MSGALLVLTLLAADAAPRVGVSDFQSTKELQPLAAALAGVTANELQRLGAFEVTTTDQLRSLMSLERQQQLLGCPDDGCRGAAVLQLGFDSLVTGKLTRLGSGKGASLSLELVLIAVKPGKREASDVLNAATESELMRLVPGAVIKLVGAQLKLRSGELVVRTDELGAAVKVDDVLVGVTPLGSVTVAGGPHLLTLEKDGFVTWRKEIRIGAGQTLEETARLVPSPDFIEAWKKKHGALRIAAWSSSGVAAASLALGVVMGLRAQAVYGSEGAKGTFLYERRFVLEGVEVDESGNHREAATSLKAQVETARTLSIVGLAVGGAALAGAVALWLLADDPHRYDGYQRAVQLTALVAPGQGGLALFGHF